MKIGDQYRLREPPTVETLRQPDIGEDEPDIRLALKRSQGRPVVGRCDHGAAEIANHLHRTGSDRGILFDDQD